MTEPFNPEFLRALDDMDTGAYRVVKYDLEGTFRPTAVPPPRSRRDMRMALRGYDVMQVDDLLRQAEEALAFGSEIQRVVARQALRSAELDSRTPGYSRGSVNSIFDQLTKQLGGGRLALPAGSGGPDRDGKRPNRHRGRHR